MGYMGEKDNWTDWTVHYWADWLNERLGERQQVFLSDPDELTASFFREKSSESGYRGHELIELIQNADDAGIGYSAPNRLLIRLTETGLFVANTGVPFSPEGIKSLMVSDNSPKQLLRTKCIGYKGLGFRSILGWASSIIILSGKLSIGFNEKFAENWLSDLRERDQRVDIKVKKYEALGYPAPIATLSIPYLITPKSRHLEVELNSIYEEGRKILADGYDTVICLLFKNSQKTHEQVQKQINLLGREILLFLQFLERIEIQSPSRNECLTVERKEDEILLNPDITTPEIWKIFKREGDIPKEYLKPEQILHDKYEIKLAIPSKPVDVNRLFVFFPTEVRFPFPIIVHATFEVSDNRQNLIDSEVNRYISEELANLMAESAEKIKDTGNPWYALSTISPTGDIDPVLEKFNFLDTLLQKAKAYALIPVRDNAFGTSSKSKRIRGNFDNSLTGEIFHDLCIYVDDPSITKQLQRLGVDYIDYDDLRERLNRISGVLTINDRVELVYLLIENSIINGEPPELLIDESGEKIVAGISIFLPPEAKVFSLPNWVPQRLLNSEMTALLKAKFSVSRVRDLASTLKPFNVDEYNLNSLVSSIQAETNRNCKDNPEEELSLRKQTIQVIWNLYSSSEEKGKLRDEITIILPTRNGSFESAKDLYFGKEYENGRILECLYAHIDPNSFVASPEKLGFVSTSKEIEEFLSWVRVSKSPRYISMDKDYSKRDFLDYVMFSLKYPARFNEIAIENVQQLRECYKTLREVTNIDRIEQVISTADPHALICWIATNPDVDSWRIDGDKSATFEIKRSGQWNYRRLLNQFISSYPLWLLRATAWLPIEGGNKLSPNKCCIAPGARDISPVVGYPALDMEHPLIKALNLDRTAIISALIKIGVVTDLDTLPWDSFYEILLELPSLDQQGGKAKSIYRKLFGRSENDIDPSGQKYQEFMNKGKMLGRKKGELKYFPINRLYYLENITLPDKIQEQYPLVEIDRRRGASKVKKLFGIEQLTRDKIQIEVLSSEEHPCAQNFQSEIDRIKPHIYALRVEEDADRVQLNALKRLKINLCRSVRVAMVVDNERQEIELQDGDSINIDSEAYLVAQPDYTNTFLLEAQKIADPVGEIISNIFKVDMNDKIARILTCPPTDRDWILDRIVGGSGAERIGKSKEIFKITVDDKEPLFSKPPIWQPPIEPEQKEKGEEVLKPEPVIAPNLVGEVSVIDKGVITPLPKKIVIRKVQLNPKTDTPLRARKVVNPDRAENLAIEFEKEEKRCPMKISHITGYDSFGCDILSFKSESDLNAFRQNNDLSLVDRFIEVKGRSSEKGSITLKGNQLRSAQAHKEGFFIYRIYEEEKTGIFELVMINDPLSCEKDALEPQYEINPFRSAKSHKWEVEEKDVVSLNEQVN